MDAEHTLLNRLKSYAKLERLNIDGVEINYLIAGSGEPLLLLHGANMGWGQWYENIDELAKNFTVYALDLPGAGKSTKIAYQDIDTQSHFVELTEKFIEKMQLKHLHIIAHSLGAWVALKLILGEKTHIANAVLVSPMGFSINNPAQYAPFGINAVAKFLAKYVMKINPKNMRRFVESGFYDKRKLEKDFFNYYYENIKDAPGNHPVLLFNKLTGVLKVKKEFVLLELLKKIRVPILIIVGAHDKIVKPHGRHLKAFKLVPQSKTEIMNDSSHVPFLEEKEKFNKIAIEFLKTSA